MNKDTNCAIVFRCPGLHGSGCPDKEILAFGIGNVPEDGLSLHAVVEVAKREGWMMSVCHLLRPDGGFINGFEPVCGDCGKRILQSAVDEAGGRVDPSAQPFVRRVLGSETPS